MDNILELQFEIYGKINSVDKCTLKFQNTKSKKKNLKNLKKYSTIQ